MHLYFGQNLLVSALLSMFALKVLASVISLSFGFRGGLFFASLFLGSLLGSAYAHLINQFYPDAALNINNAALVGMAALAVAVVGGPMTMSLIVLEVTHDFALTAAVFSATLFCNAIVRDRFGFNFATWRMHLRGETLHNARDIGWVRALEAQKLMRTNPMTISDASSIGDMRNLVPLSSTSRVFLVDQKGQYHGLVFTAEAYIDQIAAHTPLLTLARQADVYVRPDMDIASVKRAFDNFGVDELAVVDKNRKLLGFISEKYVNRRYAEELERSQRDFFGET
jgi:CIC family chloride channel protein